MAKRDKGLLTGESVTYQIPSPAGGVQLETFIPWKLVKRGVKREILTPIDAPEQFQAEAEVERQERKAARDTPLVRALGLAHYWQQLLEEGKYRSLTEIARAEGMDVGQVSRIARLTQLAPDVVERCLAGKACGLRLDVLLRQGVCRDWGRQRSR